MQQPWLVWGRALRVKLTVRGAQPTEGNRAVFQRTKTRERHIMAVSIELLNGDEHIHIICAFSLDHSRSFM